MQTATHSIPSFDELYHQLRQLPEHLRGEILHGKLITSPRPAPRHALACLNIGHDLVPFSRHGPNGAGDWWILPEPELRIQLPGETEALSPDFAGWKRERMPQLPKTAHITLTPDWICEVLSPTTARYDRKGKAQIYHYIGVTWYWLVDPSTRTLEVYRREGDFWVRIGIWEDDE